MPDAHKYGEKVPGQSLRYTGKGIETMTEAQYQAVEKRLRDWYADQGKPPKESSK